nr:MAG TPA: hypothetical protein [Caudoviricetes sp.]
MLKIQGQFFYITQNCINYLYTFIIFTINNIINSHTYTKNPLSQLKFQFLSSTLTTNHLTYKNPK